MHERTVAHTRSLWRHRILELQEHKLEAGEERREALVMEAPDWVNVIPVLGVRLIRRAEITHSLVVAAFHLLDLDPKWGGGAA